jgi:hypothetical protein
MSFEIGGRTDACFEDASLSGRMRTVFSLGSMSETVTGGAFGSSCSAGADAGFAGMAASLEALGCIPGFAVVECAPLSFAWGRLLVPALDVALVDIKY